MPLSLRDAIDRGLKQNLGALLSSADIRLARGQRWEQLSALLPHVTAAPYADVSQINLNELGISFTIPGVRIPPIVLFSYFDARVNVDQSLFDWKSINATRAASQSLKSAQYSYKDARDLVVLAVGYTYLQGIADEARIETAEAQVKTAQALFDQATDQVTAGTSPAIDGLRAKVELQTRQQQLIQAKNNFAIQKAAVAGYFPSLSFSADYGVGGKHLSTGKQVFDVRGTLLIPIFQGGSVHGDVLVADARLEQSRERLDNLRAQIDSDVRTALLNLESSAEQVAVARSNIDLSEQTLTQSRDRFSAGVTDTVEVVQSQQTVASAHEQYISSLYSYNFAKISLARALGVAEEGVKEYFKGK
jgi:outer membrane protein TolC